MFLKRKFKKTHVIKRKKSDFKHLHRKHITKIRGIIISNITFSYDEIIKL